MKIAALFSLTVLLAIPGRAADDELKPGLESGDFVGVFYVQDITGPAKGDTLCYRCKYGGRPVVSIFTRDVKDEVLLELLKGLDKTVAQNADLQLRALLVLLTDEPEAAEEKLRKLAEKTKIKNVPLTVFADLAGPPAYRISKDAQLTVMMWVGGKVKVNRAFGKEKQKLEKKHIKGLLKETDKLFE
jgi:hypothetical protein